MYFPKTAFHFIQYFVNKQWIKFSSFILISIIWAINDTIFPYFLKRIVNILPLYENKPEQIYMAVKWILVLLVVFWVAAEILQRIQGIIQVYTLPRFRADIREAVFTYVQSHSHEYFSSHFSGSIAKRLADLPNCCQTIMEIICFQYITALTGAAIVLYMMWMTKPIFAVIVFLWLAIHIGLTCLFLRYGNELWAQHSDSVSTLNGKIVDAFTNMFNVRLFSRAKYELKYLKRYQKDEIKKAKKAMWLMELTRVGLGLNGLFLIFGIVFLLLYGWEHRWVTVGDFTQVSMQTFWLFGWIWFISYQMTVFARDLGTIRDALTLVSRGHDVVDQKNASHIKINQGKIVFENVKFSYKKKRRVFKKLNLIIEPGQKIGLVGFSGSGKSTFVNLILRFYDVQSGRILVDDQDIATVTQDSLRAQIAMIPQDPALFHRSLMENIRYGRLEATDEEVIEAAKLAHANEFIEICDDGYQSLVGERGIKLSGGQRQRISIARAILKNAPILILDEATSSLDTVTEKMIQESLQSLMKGRTTIAIAHRLSTLSNMDRIIVFQKGEIVEEGSKEQLLQMRGYFSKLWNMQTDGFLPADHNDKIEQKDKRDYDNV